MSAAKPSMKFDQYDLGAMKSVIEKLDETGCEFTGKVVTYAAALTVKWDEDADQHVVTAVEAR